MDFNVERVDPFADTHTDMWMRIEHLGRYLFAADFLASAGCSAVADLAFGTGYGIAILAQALGTVVGADRDEQTITEARRKYGRGGVTFCRLDFDNDSFELPHTPFDAVTCFETIEHVCYPQALLDAICGVLCGDGVLLLSVPNSRYERIDEHGNNLDPFHVNIFEKDEMCEMLADAGFRIEHVLGQDMCNRIVAAASELMSADDASKEQLQNLLNIHSDSDIMLAARLFGYPSDAAPDESYSRIYVCRRC